MERIINLTDVVRREVMDYHGPALKATTHFFEDTVDHSDAVIMVPEYQYPRRSKSNVVVMARIVGDYVVIDEDTTDRPL